MTTLEQVKTYVQNHLVAVVATSVLALVSVSTIATGYQTLIGKSKTGLWGKFNLNNYEVIQNLFGSKEEKTSGEESENNGDGEEQVEVKIKGDENQMQQPPVDEAKDQH